MPDTDEVLGPARRLSRCWNKSEPIECRAPVPLDVALALFSLFMATGNISAAVLTILGFHCLVRTEELVCLRCADLMLAPDIIKDGYPHVSSLLAIPKPKLRTGVGRNNTHSSSSSRTPPWPRSSLGCCAICRLKIAAVSFGHGRQRSSGGIGRQG